jgi:hypothetical protein
MSELSVDRLLIVLVVGLLGLAGCAANAPLTSTEGDNIQEAQNKLLGDMPLPNGARIINENSLILGGGDGWAGRVAIASAQGSTETFTFFRDQFPKSGWVLVSSTKTKNSILVFIKKDRTATIEIEEVSLMGSKANVMLTVAPRSTVLIPAAEHK